MDPKPRPDDELERRLWRSLSGQRRLEKIAELSDRMTALAKDGLRHRHPELSEAQLREKFLALREQWRRSSY